MITFICLLSIMHRNHNEDDDDTDDDDCDDDGDDDEVNDPTCSQH